MSHRSPREHEFRNKKHAARDGRVYGVKPVCKYPVLLLRLLPLLVGIPFLIAIISDISGASVPVALGKVSYSISRPDSIATFWLPIVLPALVILSYLAPILDFACGRGKCGANPLMDARLALNRFNKSHTFIILVSIAGFALGEIGQQAAVGALRHIGLAGRFGLLSAISKGLLAGVTISFNIDNILFPAKKAALEYLPGRKLKKERLYLKIFLVVASISLFLIFQFFGMSSLFFDITSAMAGKGQPGNGAAHILEFALENADAHKMLGIIYLKVVVYIVFIIELVLQLKYMIQHPLDTMKDRLATLNSGDVRNATTIDILSNDEFALVFGEINTLIRRQKEELECSSTRLDTIVERAADPILSFDKTGKILVFNPAACAFFGYTEEEALATPILSLIEPPGRDEWPGEDCTETEALIAHLSGSANGIKRFTGLRKDGTRLTFEGNVSSADSSDTVIYTAILRDISEHVELEGKLTNAKVAAENANRMKTEFLANMSHELRTPLNAVLGFTQLLSSDKNLTPGQLEKIAIISRSGEHLLSLINDILDISKIEAGKQEMHATAFDLARFVEDIKEMFSLRCQKNNLGLYVEFTGPVPKYVKGDLGKLRQVMINLVGNAVKFTSEGGIGIIVGPDSGKIRFSVADSGKGIPVDELELIMQPFVQSSITDNEGGTGLGLAISSRYVQMMGGALAVTSEVGKGSTFSFAIDLPETVEAPDETDNEPIAVAVKKGTSVTALIVDDKEMNRLVLKEMLEGAGILTIEAENGQIAVERAREFRPQMIFMDIKMPVMDGYESVRLLKDDGTTKAIPVFALTASAFVNDEARILSSGFDGFLAKPFKRGALFRLIHDKANVDLEYETAEVHGKSASVPDPAAVDFAAAAKKLGEPGIAEIGDAIAINDFTAVRAIAARMAGENPALAALLDWHAESYDESALEGILQSLKNAAE
jgi:PAS domain S-box-containing protein